MGECWQVCQGLCACVCVRAGHAAGQLPAMLCLLSSADGTCKPSALPPPPHASHRSNDHPLLHTCMHTQMHHSVEQLQVKGFTPCTYQPCLAAAHRPRPARWAQAPAPAQQPCLQCPPLLPWTPAGAALVQLPASVGQGEGGREGREGDNRQAAGTLGQAGEGRAVQARLGLCPQKTCQLATACS